MHLLVLMQSFPLSQNKNESESKDSLVIRVLKRPTTKKQIVRSDESIETHERNKAYLSDKIRSFDRQSKARRVNPFATNDRNQTLSLAKIGESEDPFKIAAKTYTKKKREASATNDHLPEVALGDLTQLNTIEHKFFGFYQRIRQKLEQFWGRSIQEKAQELARAGRHIASSDEFATSLRVTLDQSGKVVNVELTGASGVRELDQAAIEAFNEAGPFPNPPRGLIIDGSVVLEWGFIVNT